MKKRVGSIALTVLVALVALASVVSMLQPKPRLLAVACRRWVLTSAGKNLLVTLDLKDPSYLDLNTKLTTLHHSHSETVTQGRDMSHLDGTTMAHGRQEESGKLEVEMKRLSLAYLSICVPIR